jgi:hypothetical protein
MILSSHKDMSVVHSCVVVSKLKCSLTQWQTSISADSHAAWCDLLRILGLTASSKENLHGPLNHCHLTVTSELCMEEYAPDHDRQQSFTNITGSPTTHPADCCYSSSTIYQSVPIPSDLFITHKNLYRHLYPSSSAFSLSDSNLKHSKFSRPPSDSSAPRSRHGTSFLGQPSLLLSASHHLRTHLPHNLPHLFRRSPRSSRRLRSLRPFHLHLPVRLRQFSVLEHRLPSVGSFPVRGPSLRLRPPACDTSHHRRVPDVGALGVSALGLGDYFDCGLCVRLSLHGIVCDETACRVLHHEVSVGC